MIVRSAHEPATSNVRANATQNSRRRRFQWVAAVGSLLVALFAAEIGLRLAWHNNYRGQSADVVLALRVQPTGRDWVYERRSWCPENPLVRFRTNARSYIEPAFRHRDPQATVAFLGGSTTECALVAENLRFPAHVSTLLEAQGLRVNTLNAARSGNNSHDAINILTNHVIDDRPDAVVMMHAANDVGCLARARNYQSRQGRPETTADVKRWLVGRVSAHSQVAGLLRHLLARTFEDPGHAEEMARREDPAIYDKLPADAYRLRLELFIAVCRAQNAEPVLMTEPLSSQQNHLTPGWAEKLPQERFNTIIRDVCREKRVVCIDLAEYLRTNVPNWDVPGVVFYDGLHVNDAGSRIYAEAIAGPLEKVLRQRLSPSAEAQAGE